MIFWILAALMTAALVLALVGALARGRAHGATDRAAQAVYRDQLAEVDRDLARGAIGADEAEAARVEIARRLLSADRAARRAPERKEASAPRTRLVAITLLVLVPAGALALYLPFGNPGLPPAPGPGEMPLAGPPAADGGQIAPALSQADFDRIAAMSPSERADFFTGMADRYATQIGETLPVADDLVRLAQLRALAGDYDAAAGAMLGAVELDGGDPRLHARLAQYRLDAGDPAGAVEAAKAAIGLAPDDAAYRAQLGRILARAGDLDGAAAALAEAVARDPRNLVHLDALATVYLERDGEEAPSEATAEVLERILGLEPRHLAANWFLGLHASLTDRPAEAVERWRVVLSALDPQTEEHATLAREIARLEQEAAGRD